MPAPVWIHVQEWGPQPSTELKKTIENWWQRRDPSPILNPRQTLKAQKAFLRRGSRALVRETDMGDSLINLLKILEVCSRSISAGDALHLCLSGQLLRRRHRLLKSAPVSRPPHLCTAPICPSTLPPPASCPSLSTPVRGPLRPPLDTCNLALM
jgi:hypothetical protein